MLPLSNMVLWVARRPYRMSVLLFMQFEAERAYGSAARMFR